LQYHLIKNSDLKRDDPNWS